MPKILDPLPLSIVRTKRSFRYEFHMNDLGELIEVQAHRKIVAMNNGVEVGNAQYANYVTVPAASIPNAVKARLVDLEALVDNLDV